LFALAGRKRHQDHGDERATGPRAVTATDLRAAQLGRAFDTWAQELAGLGGVSAEVDIAALGNTVLDLTSAHPSGIAQLYAGRTTALRSLVREKAAYARAEASAEAVKAKADRHAATYGLPPTQLGLGIAFWSEPGPAGQAARPRRVPIMLRPVGLHRGRQGIELELEPNLVINPVLIELLTASGIPLDPEAMARDAVAGTSFNPAPVLEAIRAMGQAVFADFRVKNKLIIGVFEHPGRVLAEDLASARDLMMRHPVVAALAGDLEARAQLARSPLPALIAYDRPPDHERGVGDLSVAQFHVLDAVAAGASVLVDAPAGAPTAATVAAVIADAVGSGQTVLYVSSNAAAKAAVAKTLRAFGLGECLQDLEPSHDWRDRSLAQLVSGLGIEAPAVDADGIGQIRAALAERGSQITAYLEALHQPLEEWGVSPYDALQALAQLTEAALSPRTACQLDRPAIAALAGEARAEAKAALRQAAQLGLFKLTPELTAWLGAEVPTPERAQALLAALDRLRAGALARSIDHMRDVTERTGLKQSAGVEDWGRQLDMLRGVREALDQFIPEIFERSPSDMVAATATPEWRAAQGLEMKGRLRRRLRRQARDLVRPGLQVEDLHQALRRVDEQRDIWLSWSPSVPWPKLPVGMRQIEAEYDAVRADLDLLDAALALPTPLRALPFAEASDFLDRLQGDRDSLEFLPQLHALRHQLAAMGLDPLVADLRQRQAGPELGASGPEAEAALEDLAAEVDFAWWSSLLAWALKDHPNLAAMGGAALAALVDSYRELDIAHTATKPLPIRAAAVASRDRAAEAYPGQAFKLAHLQAGASLRQAFAQAPDVAFKARPCVLAGPVMVPQALPLAELGGPPVDLVIADAADTLTPALAAPAIARGRQVVVVGDAARAAGPAAGATLTGAAAEFLPHVILPADADERDPRVTALLEEVGYRTLGPALPSRERGPRVTWTRVDAVGQVAGQSTRIDASASEVEATVALVEAHLGRWPDESLAVLTASPAHAQRVRSALEHAAKSGRQLIGKALALEGAEPLLVADSAQAVGVSRDAVIFAPGLAKSPRGAVLYEFGSLAGEAGGARLADVLLAGRRRLTVVSSLTTEELDDDRLRGSGPRLFKAVINTASHPRALPAAGPQVADPLFADLARRVERRGTHVTANYGGPAGPWLGLAVRPDSGPAREVVAVLTDSAAFMAEPSIRAKMRFWPAALERAGWRVRFAWTAPVFMEPEAEARAVAKLAFAKG
jgi:hypothetical protein